MTLLEIVEQALINLGEDPDAETVEEYKQGFGIAEHVNSGYMQVCERDYRPCRVEQVALDEDGCFLPSALVYTVLFIEGVYPEGKAGQGAPRAHYALPDSRVCVLNAKEETVDVVYRYLPDMLMNDTDAPLFPERFHDCLADYAAYRVMGTGSVIRQQRAQFFLQEFERKRQMIQPWGTELGGMFASAIKNKFA